MPVSVLQQIKRFKGHRKTDFEAGSVNVSEEVAEFLRHLVAKVSPESIGYHLAKEKERLRLEMEDVDRRAHELFGVSTIEEWIATEKGKERSAREVLQAQVKLRDSVKDEILGELRSAWQNRHDNGRRFDRHQDVAWARNRFQKELRTLNLSPEEFVKKMSTTRDRAPEVA
jgi:hypothetical protein